MSRPEDVKNCQRCNASLERGYSAKWSGEKAIEVICFKCANGEEFQEYVNTKTLTTHLIMNNYGKLFDLLDMTKDPDRIKSSNKSDLVILRHRLDIQIASLEIQEKIKEFESKVWFGGLQEIVSGTSARGVCAKTKNDNNFCVLTYTIAGRTMFTIEDDHASISTVASDTGKESSMGLQGIRALFGEAIYLLDQAIEKWENKTLVFKDDAKVGII